MSDGGLRADSQASAPMQQNADFERVQVPLLDLECIHAPLRTQMETALRTVLSTNRFIGGPEVESFEAEIAAYCGTQHAVGVSSGTDALIVSLMALNIGPGDEVIVPTFTFFSTAGSIHRVGATPVFCDIDPVSFNMDPASLESCITGNTRAVMPVHLFGQCVDMDAVRDICGKRSIHIIEDAAQAIGAEYKGRRAGSMGAAGCFSFFPSKNLGAIGDAGAITTDDAEIAASARRLRDHGAERRYYHAQVGGNFRLDALQAAALRVKLPHLETWHAMRRQTAHDYREALSDLEDRGLVRLPVELPERRHIFNQYVIRVHARDALQTFLSEHRVGNAIYYPVPLHLQECFAHLDYAAGNFPHAEKAAHEVLALPVFPGLTDVQKEKVTTTIRAFYENRSQTE